MSLPTDIIGKGEELLSMVTDHHDKLKALRRLPPANVQDEVVVLDLELTSIKAELRKLIGWVRASVAVGQIKRGPHVRDGKMAAAGEFTGPDGDEP